MILYGLRGIGSIRVFLMTDRFLGGFSGIPDFRLWGFGFSEQLDSIELTMLEQIKESQEQTRYLEMIKTNTEISNYLQLGTYLKISQY